MSKYKNMIINPECEGNIFDTYPQLQPLVPAGTNDAVTWHSYFRYLALCYDPNSPLIRQYADLKLRKEAAKNIVGYEEGEYPAVAIQFIKNIVGQREWTLICSLDFTFDEYTDKVNTRIIMGEDPDKELKAVELKNKMLTQMAEMIEKRDVLIRKMFQSDDDLVDIELADMTPEKIAKMGKKY